MSLLLLMLGGQTAPQIPVIITHYHTVDASGVALPSLRGASAGMTMMAHPSASITRPEGDTATIVIERRASAEVSK